MKLYDIVKELVEMESPTMGPNGHPLVGAEIDEVAKKWTNTLKRVAKENNYEILLISKK